ncbi:hypothetical protein APV28_4403 [Comamonas testosteroni]|nr:hypothetical protein APV28_4403 [Comamonas testosteroni]
MPDGKPTKNTAGQGRAWEWVEGAGKPQLESRKKGLSRVQPPTVPRGAPGRGLESDR